MNEYNQDIDYSRRGPWDVPLRSYIKELKIVVLIHNLETEEIEKEFYLDYGSMDDRKFMGRLSFWCVTNGRSLETLSTDDWKSMK